MCAIAAAVSIVCFFIVGPWAHAAAAAERALLWRLERAGSEPSYLFGTIHLSLPDVVDVSPAVRAAILEADLMMGEGAPYKTFAYWHAIEAMQAPPHERAAVALDHDLLTRLIEAAACYGLEPEEVTPQPLWMLVPLLVLMQPHTSRAEMARQREGALPLDAVLAEMAAAAGKLTVWIESPRQQIDFFRDMPWDDLVGLLRQVARPAQCPPDDAADTMVELYRARDIEGMLAAFERWIPQSEDPALWRRFERILITQRNHTMADRIERFAAAGSVFVAVGAGHLAGEEGLIALLRERGWHVSPIE